MWQKFSLAAICVVLAACSTTQKSSTGSGDQAPAPISEAGKSGAAATPDSANGKSSNSTGQSKSGSADSADAAAANAGSKSRSSEGAANSESEEAAQLKRQLEDQDAQIKKLRGDQLAIVGQEEAMDSERSNQQSAAGAGDRSDTAGATSASKAQDELAVFPSDRNAGDAGSQPGVAAVLEHSVYFDYDQFSIPDKYDSMLINHAAYLKAHPDVRVEVQGNCDERGSREYNLALGARRAESVKRALELSGAEGSHISAVSYGAEKPVASGKDEESYRKNRRVDIFY